MLTLDGTALVQLVNFAIFFAILSVVFLRPVGRAIRKRREYIDGVQADYERFQSEARAARADAGAIRLKARRAAEETVGSARREAEAEAARVSGEFAAKAETIANEARATVALELSAAQARQPELASELASQLLERAVGTPR